MICHRCREAIESREACIPEHINGSDHYWFFHPGCYAERIAEKEQAEQRLQNIVRMARQVH